MHVHSCKTIVRSKMCDITHQGAGVRIRFEDDVTGLHDRLSCHHHLVEGSYAAEEAYVCLHAQHQKINHGHNKKLGRYMHTTCLSLDGDGLLP